MAKKVQSKRKRHHEVIMYEVKVFFLILAVFIFPVTYTAYRIVGGF